MAVMTDSRADATADVAHASPALLDEAAFERLYADAARPLWSYLYRVLGDATEAEDLMQEAFLKVLRAPVGTLAFDAQRGYLFRIASNLAVDRFRARRRRGTAEAQLERDLPRTTAIGAADLDVTRGFGQLTPRERALLWMAYVEGSAHEEIAESLRVKPGSVRVLLFRARRRMRELLARAAPAFSIDGAGR
jgi:RNA polymerase sigma-70 factor (ECF subfamily)